MKQESNISSCNAVHHVLVTCQVTSTELSVILLLPFGNKKHNQRSSNLCSSVISTLSSNMKEMFIHTLQLCTLFCYPTVYTLTAVWLYKAGFVWKMYGFLWDTSCRMFCSLIYGRAISARSVNLAEKNTKQIYVSKMMLAWIASCGSRMLDSKAVSSLTPNVLLWVTSSAGLALWVYWQWQYVVCNLKKSNK